MPPKMVPTSSPRNRQPTRGLYIYLAICVGLMSTVLIAFQSYKTLRLRNSSDGPLVVQPPGVVVPVESASQQRQERASQQQQGATAHLMTKPASQGARVVIVGGGLAGCAAALSAQAALASQQAGDNPVEVVLVEKTPKLGGNSAKASSGINALNPAGGDSQQLFAQDTLESGGDLCKPELVSTLVAQSQDAVQFLQHYGVDLSKVTQLGGHSVPRSRTNPVGGNVGWSIMSKVTDAVKEAGITRMEGHKLEEVVLGQQGGVQGVVLSRPDLQGSNELGAAQQATLLLPAQAVILAAGGFAANRSLLQQHSPEAADLATTNGPWAQGDVLGVAERAGAKLRDLDQVQVHPTGFVDPKEPQAGTKFLAPEKLRGVGGILLNSGGRRFVNELATRDKASAALNSQPGKEAWLVLSEAAAADYGLSAVEFYVKRGLMAKVEGVAGLSAHTGASEEALAAELQQYNEALEGHQPDPFGKTVFPTGFDAAGVMYVARVTPVVHYTMGGIDIDSYARVLTTAGEPIPGLYAAGEVSAGVHGRNRLGGNSLLECVVYGRIAGHQAAQYTAAMKAAAV